MATGTQLPSQDDNRIFENLKEWVVKAGGSVNAALHIQRRTADLSPPMNHGIRGIFAKDAIAKGELLLKIPAKCVLSGEKLPRKFKDRIASPWLRCLACLYGAQGGSEWEPYMESLPVTYETLWQWRDQDLQYLDGTTLGRTLRADREDGSLQQRYDDYVRPYLRFLKILSKKDEKNNASGDGKSAMDTFRQASMCISTRGFHMRPPGAADGGGANPAAKEPEVSREVYMGPFLLPMIDLLNHSESFISLSNKNKSTTLQREQGTGDFYMVAERDIVKGEEVTHSYGDQLTSGQMLQTFGFVPESKIQQQANISAVASTTAATTATTPAVFSKEELVDACSAVKKSTTPKELQQAMNDNDIEGEVWDLPQLTGKDRRDTSFISDQLLVAPSSAEEGCLSEEIVSLCAIQMLPQDVYTEIFGDNDDRKLLGTEILEDYYLGKLVISAILTAIKFKLATYKPLGSIEGIADSDTKDDKSLLQDLLERKEPHSESTLRALYGITVRLEEKKALDELRNEAVLLLAGLDDDDDDLDGEDDRPSKRLKSVPE